MKNKRLLQSLNFIDEKYIKEAEPKMTTSSNFNGKNILKAACFILVIALSLYLFIPFSTKGPDLTAYSGSEYFPIIEKISALRYQPSPYKNNFQYVTAEIGDFFDSFSKMDGNLMAPDMEPPTNGEPTLDSNGKYEESTDNQVSGVIEADLMKRTDKYIFRLSLTALRVYSIDGENTKKVAEFNIPGFNNEKSDRYYEREMYLSEDAKTITVISPYYNESYDMRVRIISIDISDLQNIQIKKTISIDGNYISSRMVDGKLLFISEFYAKNGEIDYNNPETYVPTVTDGDVTSCIKFEDIIYPEKLGSTRYSVVALIEEESLELLGANALLDFYNDIYVSENNVYVTKEYVAKEDIGDDGAYKNVDMSDIAILGYSGDTLEKKGVITVEGHINDQYSMDEYEGHFRVVTSTEVQTVAARKFGKEIETVTDGGIAVTNSRELNASLYVFNLEGLEKVAEVVNFAPSGESVSSARFDKESAYVCTAIVQTMTDPVFFFDLSDYSNITYTDTGVIDGFSSSLIQLGDGFLLGIGRENWSGGKIEVYEERENGVVSVDKYVFEGVYASIYKAYYVNREDNMFGFAVGDYYDKMTGRGYDTYILLYFNGYELVEVENVSFSCNGYPDRVRAFVKDGYLYITDDKQIKVEAIG